MTKGSYNLLFLCTGNSARSIMAEAIANKAGRGRFRAYSAGSHPTGTVNPFAIDLLERMGYPTRGLRSKSWDEFAAPGAPEVDFVFTVCDNAAGEVCPIWPGKPVTAHWGFPDPAARQGTDVEKAAAFADVFAQVRRRVDAFAALPFDTLDRLALTRRVRELAQPARETT